MIAAITLNISIDRRYHVAGLRPGKVHRVDSCTYTAGGKGLNVARVAKALGEEVTAGGFIGGDAGRYVMRRLQQDGIAHFFTRVSGETRTCINIIDTAASTHTEFLEPGMAVSPDEWARFLSDFDSLAARSDIVTLSGSLPPGLAPGAYAELITRAKNQNKKVILDTSGKALLEALAARPMMIKPNREEAAALAGKADLPEEELAKAANALHLGGIGQVVISLGEKGALLACSRGVFIGVPPRVTPVNTVGCGDAMTAAFAVAAFRGMDAQEALRFAVGVSCASTLSPDTGGLDMRDFDAVIKDVRVRSL